MPGKVNNQTPARERSRQGIRNEVIDLTLGLSSAAWHKLQVAVPPGARLISPPRGALCACK